MSKRWPTSRERASREVLPLHLALYHAARDYPGGSKAISAVYGVPPSTLQHRLNPNADNHRLTLDELEQVLATTRDPRILDSITALVPDAYWFSFEGCDETPSDQQLMDSVADLTTRMSTLLTRIAEHRRDGVYDAHEIAELRLLKSRLIGSIKCVVELAQEFDCGVDE